MDNSNLPPLPRAGEVGPEVCAVVRLYLAVIDDLTAEQVELLSEHVVACAACGEEFSMLERATHLVGSFAATAPSQRVDAAVQAMMTAQPGKRTPVATRRSMRGRSVPRRRAAWILGELVAAAAIVLALFTSAHFFGLFGNAGPQSAFALPSTLSWSQYVVFHTENRLGTRGELYQVETYHDLGTDAMHVETTMDGQVDVVVVSDNHEMLGMDMIHHVAQMGTDSWMVDDSLFDLSQLRHDIQTHNAVYLDTDSFKGQKVYRIRWKDGLVLLLDMQYRPVNVLRGAVGPGTGAPIYTTLKLMPSSQVSSSMWDMSVPQGFQMGQLPEKP